MAKKTVENLQPMSEAREAINDNFTELYAQLGGGSSGSTSNLYGVRLTVPTGTDGDATILSQTSDFIETITRESNTSNNYDIVFKDGVFTETPMLVTGTINMTGDLAETIQINSGPGTGLNTGDYANGKKIKVKWESVSNTTAQLQNSPTAGAHLVFMAVGADAVSSGSSSSGSYTLAFGTINSDGSLANSFGVSSASRTATGKYQVNLTQSKPSVNYVVTANCLGTSVAQSFIQSKTADNFTVHARRVVGGANGTGSEYANASIDFVVMCYE